MNGFQRSQRIIFFLTVWTSFSLVAAQLPNPGDKKDGEEELILERERWFSETRGIDQIHRPDRLRGQAIEITRAMRDSELNRSMRAAWTPLGPAPMNMFSWAMGRVAGRISALAVHPTNDDIIYLGAASGGLWKTTNGGGSWTPIFDDIGTLTIGSVTIDPHDAETIWVGTGEQRQSCTNYFGLGLFKSTDGGASFVAMNGTGANTLDLSYVAAVSVHPSDPQIILAGGHGWCNGGVYQYGGLFRSIDGGQTWARLMTGSVNDIIADPSSPGTFYAAAARWGLTDDGIYKSTDAFATWNRLENGIAFGSILGRARLTMAPSNPSVLYALMNISGSGTRIYKTTNGGNNWSLQNSDACEGQCDYNLCIDVHPMDPNTILVGSIRFARSTNSGISLQYLTSGWGSSQTVHQDTHVLLYDRIDGNRFWAAGDGGVWRTDNNAASFSNLNANLNITQFYDIAVSPGKPDTIFGGSQDNSSEGTFGSAIWDVTMVTGDGFMNLVDPLNSDYVYQTSYPSGGLPHVIRSTSGGASGSFSWLSMSGCVPGDPYPWVTPLAIVANSAGTKTYQFLGSNRVYLSQNDGLTWTPLSSSGLSSYALAVIEPYATATAIGAYAGSSDGRIFQCTDVLAATPEWTEITENYPGGRVSDIAVDPSDTKSIFVTRAAFGQSRLYHAFSGSSWDAIGSGLPNVPANSVAIDPRYPNRVFVGTDTGVFESINAGSTFESMMVGFPLGAVITDLEIDAASLTLTAGTYGRGAWQTTLILDELSVDCGMDLTACSGDMTPLSAVPSNGLGAITWDWVVLQEPPGAVYTLTGTNSASPNLTPVTPGDYVFQAEVTDGLGRVANDDLMVTVVDEAASTSAMIALWHTNPGDPNWQPNMDRIADGWINIRDLVLQINDPACL